jgi:hypothetical protein
MRIVKILFISTLLSLFTSNSFSEVKKDCSMYNKDTLVGTYDKWRCEQGKEPRKKLNLGEKLKKLNPLSKN